METTVDLYGSSRMTAETVRKDHGKLLNRCIEELKRKDLDAYQTDSTAFSTALLKSYDLAFAKLSVVTYFNQQGGTGQRDYATIDVVEKADAKRRMAFLPRPTGHFADPSGLLRSWNDYMTLAWGLLAKGEITGGRVECPAFHCLFGHENPKLAPFREVFVTGVAKNKAALTRIFLEDHADQARADAAFLLAYMTDGNELVKILSVRVTDEAELVRNNVVRVFADIAHFHPNLTLPVEAIVQVLDFPATTDRNKASAVMAALVSNSGQLQKIKPLLLAKAVPILLKTLRLQQPNNHDPAYEVLRAVSGQSFKERDYPAWDAWYAGLAR